MTTHPTGDAPAASERVVEAVRDAIFEAMDLMDGLDVPSAEKYARAAIEAYQKAMREGE